MRWIDVATPKKVPIAVNISLLRRAVALRPDDIQMQAALGRALKVGGDHASAVVAFERAARQDRATFSDHADLVTCYVHLKRPEEALDAFRRGLDRGEPSSELHNQAGRAYRLIGRHEDAFASFVRAIELSDRAYFALESALGPMAKEPDGGRLLDFCDSLPPHYARCSVALAFRAIALSRVGRHVEARELVDIDRHVVRIPFEPPAEFGGIERFNQELAAEILSNPELVDVVGQNMRRKNTLDVHGSRAYPALTAFVRQALRDYLGQASARGLDHALPPPPEAASLRSAGVILYGDATNGEHIHPMGYVSGVYHVAVPPCVANATDRRGALVVGACETVTGGYAPCWGSRDFRPEPGTLTLFPSHLYHNVVPTRVNEPRIAIPVDLVPAH